MKTTKENIERLISYFDHYVMCPCKRGYIKDIFIGDVMQKLYLDSPCPNKDIYKLWCDCGLNKSLQQIIKKSGYETQTFKDSISGNTNCIDIEQLKNINARILCEFLLDIFN